MVGTGIEIAGSNARSADPMQAAIHRCVICARSDRASTQRVAG
jgi:hypothetical protein